MDEVTGSSSRSPMTVPVPAPPSVPVQVPPSPSLLFPLLPVNPSCSPNSTQLSSPADAHGENTHLTYEELHDLC